MRVNILGPLEVQADRTPAEIGGPRLRALLTRLALDPGRTVSTEALASAVWGDDLPADQANALQSLVSRLRRAMPEDVVKSVPGGYRLDVTPEDVDAVRFERAARQGREELRRGDARGAAETLRQALRLWRGDAPAIRLEELRLTALEDRIEADLQTRPSPELVAEAAELEERHPLRERPSGLLMKALAAQGRQAEALSVYERLRRRLADDLGADPSPDLQAAHVAILRGETKPKPRVRGNLKAALTSFVGREDELERIGKQLIDSRLVTLVGPGGAGKTRLAVMAGARYADRTPDGVWLAELAPVTEAHDVVTAVLRSLDRREQEVIGRAPLRGRDTMQRLVDLLADEEALLILDNCEHVIEAAAGLADELLSRCPKLRVLATSREPLSILGEALCSVTPLPLPPRGISAADALAYPAVQLLRDRGSAVAPGFDVTPDTVDATVEICRRLDGLPLAIELAAARLRTIPIDQIAARLDDRFRLLTGGSRTAMPRQRTLRAVVAWSWDLLSPEERALADRLAVFPATVTAEAAAGVAGAGQGLPEPARGVLARDARGSASVRTVPELLDSLVDKSILQLDPSGTRYRMLETIREYALDMLAESGEAGAARSAHAAYFLELVERAEPHTRRADQLEWMALLNSERDNILGALQYAADIGDADTALRIGTAMSLVWSINGTSDAAEWLGRALRTPPPHPAQELVICMAMYAVYSTFNSTYAASAATQIEDLPRLLADLDTTSGHPYLALVEPMLALFTDDTEAGLAAIDRNLAHPDPWVRAMLVSLRGHIEENDGDAEGMLRDVLLAAEQFRALGERWGLATTLTALADAYSKRGEFDAAIAALEESIRLTQELNPQDEARHQKVWLMSLRARTDPDAAREALREFIAERPGKRQSRDVAFALLALGDTARLIGEYAEAEESYEVAWQRQIEAPMIGPQLRALLRSSQAHLALARGDVDSARGLAAQGVQFALDGKDMPVAAHSAIAVAAVRAIDGDPLSAAEMLGASDQLRGLPDLSNVDGQWLSAALRETIGETAFAAAYAKGRGLGREAALALIGSQNPGA